MKHSISLVVLCLISFSSIAQNTNRIYRTLAYMDTLRQDRNVINEESRIERQMAKTLRFEPFNDFLVPIVFHVLYENEEEKISYEQIVSQLNILNEDFSNETEDNFYSSIKGRDWRKLEGFQAKREDTRVRFCFPANTPQNKETNGVNYIKTKVVEFTDFETMKDKKEGAKAWDTNKYINVWICDLSDNNSGFAQMPFGPKDQDGIVIDYRFVGTMGTATAPYDGGHSLTHLLGNYLHLYPIWGEFRCGDDRVKDTPLHNAPNYRCENVAHQSTCEGNPVEMVNNFMDNTDDVCLNMFTKGQMKRIQMVLHPKGPRGKLAITETECGEDPLIEEIVENRSNELTQEELDSYKITKFNVRPNPVRDNLFVEYHAANAEPKNYNLRVFTVTGQLVHDARISKQTTKLNVDVSSWNSGSYILHIQDGEQSFSEKIVVE